MFIVYAKKPREKRFKPFNFESGKPNRLKLFATTFENTEANKKKLIKRIDYIRKYIDPSYEFHIRDGKEVLYRVKRLTV